VDDGGIHLQFLEREIVFKDPRLAIWQPLAENTAPVGHPDIRPPAQLMRVGMAAQHVGGVGERCFLGKQVAVLSAHFPKAQRQLAEFPDHMAMNDPETAIDVEDRFAAHAR